MKPLFSSRRTVGASSSAWFMHAQTTLVWLIAALLTALFTALSSHAAEPAPAPLTLRDGATVNEVWPSVTLLFDAKKTMTLADALAAR